MVLTWDKVGERFYETGVEKGVLYLLNDSGIYSPGVAWNGLVSVTESPSGAEASANYADNIKYLNLMSAEELGGTIEAFTAPDEFGVCDGTAELLTGVSIGQQTRKIFGLSYRTILGNDSKSNDYGYKLHLVYGCQASPSDRGYQTVNDSPSPITLSWTFDTTPVAVTAGGVVYKPTSLVTIDSTKISAAALSKLEEVLYGTDTDDARLPLPAEIYDLINGL